MTPGSRLAARIWDMSSLWRSLSPRNRNHLLIAGSCSLVFAGVTAVRMLEGRSPVQAGLAALNAAVMLFLAWAVAREIDPDSPASAFPAAAVAGLILLGGSAPAGVMVMALLALRIVTRSTGKAPTLLDLVALAILAAGVAGMPRGWIGGIVVAAALVLDLLLPQPAPRRNFAGALLASSAAVATAWFNETLSVGFVMPELAGWAAAGLALLAFPAMRRYFPRSVQDRGILRIPPERLRAGRLLALASGLAALAAFGGAAVPLLAGLWATFIGVGLHGWVGVRRPASR